MPEKIGLEALTALSQGQRERLAYLEMKAYFCGDLKRADIEARFGVRPAAATRDLTAYRGISPHNLEYDSGQRCYRPGPRFSPIFEISPARVLAWFLQGFGDGLNLKLRRSVPCDGQGALVAPNLETLATITRAITAGHAIKASYLSLTSGASSKVLVPLALADNGLRWHLRAFDREKSRFADFVLTRVVRAKAVEGPVSERETLTADAQWARIVTIELAPHPGLKHPEAIEADYGMTNGTLRLDVRAALAGYALHRWRVDCSPDYTLNPEEHHLCLSNPPTLYGVESAVMAPGYNAGNRPNAEPRSRAGAD